MADNVEAPLCRCGSCGRWWSYVIVFFGPPVCPCGGVLNMADIEAHNATLPYTPMKSEKKPDPPPDNNNPPSG